MASMAGIEARRTQVPPTKSDRPQAIAATTASTTTDVIASPPAHDHSLFSERQAQVRLHVVVHTRIYERERIARLTGTRSRNCWRRAASPILAALASRTSAARWYHW